MSVARIPEPFTLSSRVVNIIALALLALMAVILVSSVRQQSQTFDESTHLFAGFEYWKHADFGRNPEHPPLVKQLAALPLLPMGLREPPALPIPFFKGQDVINASQLLYTANADDILLRGRVAIALFSLALGVFVFFAAKEMFSPLAAIFALFLFVFEPNLLANGAIVTTDMGLTCLLFASVYAFYRYCKQPSVLRLALCAIAAALTIIAKHSGILVIPTLVLLALADLFLPAVDITSAQDRRRHIRRLALALITICVISYVILWAAYGFRYAARPGQLQILPPLEAYAAALAHPVHRNVILFLARHHLLPEAYLYGWVDVLLIPGRLPLFLFGHFYSTARWFYFPAVFLLKTTLTLLILLLLVPFARITGRRREILFLAMPIVFFTLAALTSQINIGVRHLLPIYPFCIVLASAAAALLFNRSLFGRIAVAALLLFTAISSLHSYPDFLVYSNELFGGPSHTYRNTGDANADWGQGLKWTKAYLDQHPDSNCWFAYAGNFTVNPAYYGITCKPLPAAFVHIIGLPAAPVPSTITGTVLVSSTETEGVNWGPDDLNPYRTFRDRTPDATIGNIIFVYRGTFEVHLLAAESNAFAANALLQQGRIPEALTLAQTAVQQAPNCADAQAILGEILLASGRTAEGRDAFATARHLAQTNHPEFQGSFLAQLLSVQARH
ncbi:MAG TPA: phospholipid carrier-dependent glycosyltransferase [Edaphobacter sp.]